VLFVHGHNAPRREALRLLRVVAGQGLPALVLSYRNDPGPRPAQTACAAGGATGWRDVEAATSFALDHGATGRTLPLLVLPVPAPLTATAKAVAGVRYALDWRRLDYHRMAPVAD
jgi:hypothetical protein